MLLVIVDVRTGLFSDLTIFPRSIVTIAQAMCGKQAPPVGDPSSVDSFWGSLFGLVSSIDPSVLQQLAGIRVSTVELRILLLSKLLCFCVSETCQQRRTYIGGILQLTDHDQLVLKGIIESGGVLGTPAAKTPTPLATPPRSISRRNLDQSFASPIREDVDQITQSDLMTLMAWMQTNPELENLDCSRIEDLDTAEAVR